MLRTWRTRASQHILGGSCKLPSLMVAIMAVLIGLVSPVKSAQPVAVLTYNQYIGGDLGSLVGIPPDDLNGAFVGFLRQVAATRFLDRADRQAEQIAKAHPDLVALQEVWDLACFDLEAPAPGQGCADPSIAGAFVVGLTGSVPCVVCAKAGPARSVRTDAVHSRDDDRMMTSFDLLTNDKFWFNAYQFKY